MESLQPLPRPFAAFAGFAAAEDLGHALEHMGLGQFGMFLHLAAGSALEMHLLGFDGGAEGADFKDVLLQRADDWCLQVALPDAAAARGHSVGEALLAALNSAQFPFKLPALSARHAAWAHALGGCSLFPAVRAAALLVCGISNCGELGLGAVAQAAGFARVPLYRSTLQRSAIRCIAVGEAHAVAATVDGAALSWGSNRAGALGLGVRSGESNIPQEVPALLGQVVVGVAAGRNHSLFCCAEGDVLACGDNYSGQCGVGSTSSHRFPVAIAAFSRAPLRRRTVAEAAAALVRLASPWPSYRNGASAARDASPVDGGAFTPNKRRRSAVPQSSVSASLPGSSRAEDAVMLRALGRRVVVSSDDDDDDDGDAAAGSAAKRRRGLESGERGPTAAGSSVASVLRTPVSPLSPAASAAASGAIARVLSPGWGSPTGAAPPAPPPARVAASAADVDPAPLQDLAVVGRRSGSRAEEEEGPEGAAAGGTPVGYLSPASPPPLSPAAAASTGGGGGGGDDLGGDSVVAVAAGGDTSFALTAAGRVYAWGCSARGQSGTGRTADLLRPLAVAELRQAVVRAVAAGAEHVLFVTADGALLACGNGTFGRLGAGEDERDRTTPVRVRGGGLEGRRVVAAAAGATHSLAATDDGAVFCWGDNAALQLGLPPLPPPAAVGAAPCSSPGGAPSSSSVLRPEFVAASGAAAWDALRRRYPHRALVPTQVQLAGGPGEQPRIVGVAAGERCSVAFSASGSAFAWGSHLAGTSALPVLDPAALLRCVRRAQAGGGGSGGRALLRLRPAALSGAASLTVSEALEAAAEGALVRPSCVFQGPQPRPQPQQQRDVDRDGARVVAAAAGNGTLFLIAAVTDEDDEEEEEGSSGGGGVAKTRRPPPLELCPVLITPLAVSDLVPPAPAAEGANEEGPLVEGDYDDDDDDEFEAAAVALPAAAAAAPAAGLARGTRTSFRVAATPVRPPPLPQPQLASLPADAAATVALRIARGSMLMRANAVTGAAAAAKTPTAAAKPVVATVTPLYGIPLCAPAEATLPPSLFARDAPGGGGGGIASLFGTAAAAAASRRQQRRLRHPVLTAHPDGMAAYYPAAATVAGEVGAIEDGSYRGTGETEVEEEAADAPSVSQQSADAGAAPATDSREAPPPHLLSVETAARAEEEEEEEAHADSAAAASAAASAAAAAADAFASAAVDVALVDQSRAVADDPRAAAAETAGPTGLEIASAAAAAPEATAATAPEAAAATDVAAVLEAALRDVTQQPPPPPKLRAPAASDASGDEDDEAALALALSRSLEPAAPAAATTAASASRPSPSPAPPAHLASSQAAAAASGSGGSSGPGRRTPRSPAAAATAAAEAAAVPASGRGDGRVAVVAARPSPRGSGSPVARAAAAQQAAAPAASASATPAVGRPRLTEIDEPSAAAAASGRRGFLSRLFSCCGGGTLQQVDPGATSPPPTRR